METVHMKSPEGEVKEVEATTEALTPLMVAGWQQVPGTAERNAPKIQQPATPVTEEK